MPTNSIARPTGMHEWTNRHETFTQPIDDLFDVYNGATDSVLNDYKDTSRVIQELIDNAVKEKRRMRALGGGWSWSKVAATKGWILNTKNLNMLLKVAPDRISKDFKGDIDQLLYAQCGNSIQELNIKLKRKNRSLRTSGASNGQTIAGAISTGTHGSALDFGSTQDFVKGLHIIVSDTRQVWLERKSEPVISESFAAELGVEIKRDDDLFNAALVSFGSFGFIHGVMIETEPLFLLECYRQLIPYDGVLKKMMQTLDFTNSGLPNGDERPHHFQVIINQFDLQKGAYVTTMYKRPYRTDYAPPIEDPNAAGPGDDAPAFLGRLTDQYPVATALLVNQLVESNYAPYSKTFGTHGEIFSNTTLRGKVLSAAFAIPLQHVNTVTDLLIEANKNDGPFFGVFAFRYVRHSKATLGFTRFNENDAEERVCIVELDGVESDNASQFYDAVWVRLRKKDIPFKFHWGKINDLDASKLKDMYGENRDKWVKARNELLVPDSINLFNSSMVKEFGLDEIPPQNA